MTQPPDTAPPDLATRLGLVMGRPNGFQRVQQRLASTRVMAAVYSRTLHRVDSALRSLTSGRVTVPGVMAGLPVVFLTTVGARSGRPRTSPLIPIPFDGGIGLLGTNYAQPATPAWVVNLEAHPEAELAHRGVVVPVRAEPVAGERLQRLLHDATGVFPGFAAYPPRITGRTLRGFVMRERDR